MGCSLGVRDFEPWPNQSVRWRDLIGNFLRGLRRNQLASGQVEASHAQSSWLLYGIMASVVSSGSTSQLSEERFTTLASLSSLKGTLDVPPPQKPQLPRCAPRKSVPFAECQVGIFLFWFFGGAVLWGTSFVRYRSLKFDVQAEVWRRALRTPKCVLP